MDTEHVTDVSPIEDINLIEKIETMSDEKLKSILEAILFAASEPISLDQFQSALPEIGKRAIRRGLGELSDDYEEMGRSFHLVEIANGYQICSRSEYSEWIEKFYTRQVRVTLSPSALETLAIVAYKQRCCNDSRGKQRQRPQLASRERTCPYHR